MVAFQGGPQCHWQSCEKNPGSPSHSAKRTTGNDIHRPKVNQTCDKMLSR
ncbi:unnamed protein product, partial [Gulo gulo]